MAGAACLFCAGISLAQPGPGGAPAQGGQQGPPPPVVSLNPAAAEPGMYQLDSRHVALTARVRHLSFGYTAVHFDRISGVLDWNPADVTKSTVSIDVDPKMVSTNVPNGLGGGTFAQQIAGPQFLDGFTYPKATFVSTKVTRKDATHGVIEGNLTLHGITKPIVLETEFLAAGRDRGEPRVAFSATTTINRREFGITAFANELVGDNVQMLIDVEFCKSAQPCL
jgi:polyisoprenoid-binding protein YceI